MKQCLIGSILCIFIGNVFANADDTQQPYVWIVSESTWIKETGISDTLYLFVDAYTGQQTTHLDVEVWDGTNWIHIFHPTIPLGNETTMKIILGLGPYVGNRDNYWIRIWQTPGLHDPLGDTQQPIHGDGPIHLFPEAGM